MLELKELWRRNHWARRTLIEAGSLLLLLAAALAGFYLVYKPSVPGGALFLGALFAVSSLVILQMVFRLLGALSRAETWRQREKNEYIEERALILDNMPGYIFYIDRAFHYIYVNKNYSDLIGFSEQEILGRTAFDLWPADVAGRFIDEDDAIMTKGDAITLDDFEFKTGDRWITVSGRKVPLYSGRGQVIGMIGLLFDITAKKKIEKTLRGTLAEKEFLLSEVHHRVKNNLQVIISLLNLHISQSADGEQNFQWQESISRILAMSVAHDMIHEPQGYQGLLTDQYLKQLCVNIISYYKVTERVELELHIASVTLDLDRITLLGLCAAEWLGLISKRVIEDKRKTRLSLTLREQGGGLEFLIHSDCLTADTAYSALDEEELSSLIIGSMVQQLDGRIEEADTGAFKMVFPLFKGSV